MMLKISKIQMKQMGQSSFLLRAQKSLSLYFKGFAALDVDFQKEFVSIAYKRAHAYGLESERAIMTYLMTCWTLGPDFESRYPETKAILKDQSLSPDDRANVLHRFTAQWLEDNSAKALQHE